MKKIKQNFINIEPRFGLLERIDNYMFCYDKEIFTLTILYTNDEDQVDLIEVIDTSLLDKVIVSNRDLEIFALNWIFDNVEIVKEV